MQSSNDPTGEGPRYVEVVRSRENPLESRYVFVTVFGILLVGTLSLIFVQREGAQAFALPLELTSLTTQLSNARVEISLLQEISMLDAKPALADLIQAELPPFAQPGVLEPEPGCLVFDLEPYLVRFRQSAQATDGWSIAWLDERRSPEIDHALHALGEEESLCDDHAEWQAY
ncbi:MAG: hypothetical protein AAF541_06430 [Pseudomonadota bacterium]